MDNRDTMVDSNFEKIPEISIIVPVYNVEKYLDHSLSTIKNQTFTDWECILVDDGSTDASPLICDRFSQEDKRFRVIHQKNSGVSVARNIGLDNARGKYISFVDPDDWCEKNYLETFHTLITKYDADIVQCGFTREFVSFSRKKHLTDKERVIDRDEAIHLLLKPSGIPSLLWSKLYKRDVITEKFPEGKTYEDAYTMPAWFKNVKKVVLSPELIYHYRMRGGSITKKGVASHHYDFIVACRRLADIVHETVPDRFDKEARDAYIQKIYVDGAKTISRKEADKELRKEIIQRISKEVAQELPEPVLKDTGMKIFLRSWILSRYPSLFIKMMRGVNKFDFYAKRRTKHLFE